MLGMWLACGWGGWAGGWVESDGRLGTRTRCAAVCVASSRLTSASLAINLTSSGCGVCTVERETTGVGVCPHTRARAHAADMYGAGFEVLEAVATRSQPPSCPSGLPRAGTALIPAARSCSCVLARAPLSCFRVLCSLALCPSSLSRTLAATARSAATPASMCRSSRSVARPSARSSVTPTSRSPSMLCRRPTRPSFFFFFSLSFPPPFPSVLEARWVTFAIGGLGKQSQAPSLYIFPASWWRS